MFQEAVRYAGTSMVKLAISACDAEQQMSHLDDFQQFRRIVAATGSDPAKIIYELPANGSRKSSLTFTEDANSGYTIRYTKLHFESVMDAAQ